MPDSHKNFAYSTVATAPSPATTGTSLVVAAGGGAKFPAVSFNAVVWPAGANPLTTNAEIVRVTAIATDTFTITRTQESTSARSIVVGDQIAAAVTAKTLTDIETQPVDTFGAPTDVTTNNASTAAHGFLKKLSNVATEFMNGAGNWAVPAATLTTAEANLAADVSMATANTYYDGPSISLEAGTWFIVGVVTVNRAAGGAIFTAKLWDGTTVEASTEGQTGGANKLMPMPLAGIVAPTGTTTYKISVASDTATTVMKAAALTNAAGSNASHIRAIKVAA